MKVYLEALGCRLNAAETEELARRFVTAGYSIVREAEEASIIVLNTCAVTVQAARKSRHRLQALHRCNTQARLAVLGCWATEAAQEIARLPGVSWILPNADKAHAIERITGKAADPAAWQSGRCAHTRAFLGVQDGCDSTCTYCITRLLRGPARSTPPEQVIAAIHDLVAGGAQEVVLTGVSLGAYGRDLGLEQGLAALVVAILKGTDLPRLRLSSVEPWDVTELLLEQLRNPRFCRQLHLPLQAGSDQLLRGMGRRITTAQFARLVETARALSPDVALTSDVITGFPGETEALFAESLAFVKAMDFARLHVFPYSERKGTAATRLPDRVPPVLRHERAAEMRALGESMGTAYRLRFVGQRLPVLWENPDASGRWRGLTDTYLQVVNDSKEKLYNRITLTHLLSLEGEQFIGEVQ